MEWLKLLLDQSQRQDLQAQLNDLIQRHNALVDAHNALMHTAATDSLVQNIGGIVISLAIIVIGYAFWAQDRRLKRLEKESKVSTVSKRTAGSILT